MKLLKDITTIFIILFTSIIALGAIDDQRCSGSDSFEYGTGPSSVIY